MENFGTSLTLKSKHYYLGEDKILHFKMEEAEEVEGVYLPIAMFVTAYARRHTIETSQKIRDYSLAKYGVDKYIYSDTDSCHTTLTKEELEEICEIDDVELGKWKLEINFIRREIY